LVRKVAEKERGDSSRKRIQGDGTPGISRVYVETFGNKGKQGRNNLIVNFTKKTNQRENNECTALAA
jgi:hypothetical protein